MSNQKISELTSWTPTTSDTWVMVQWWVNKKFTLWDLPIPTSVQTALNGKQWNITLTTTGTSWAATLIGNTLNIPQYTWGGGWGAVDSVNWQTWVVVLDQDDIWDGTTYKQFSETNRKEIIRSLSTAILTYPTITINADPTKIDISSFIWRKVDGYTDMENPVATYYTFPWVTWLTITNLATQDTTYLAVNSSWTVDQLTSNDNWANSRDRVIIGSAVHTSRTQVDSIDKFVNTIWYDIANSIWDLSDAIWIINTWNKFSANGANMKINKSSWYSTQIGLNIWTSKKSPNRVSDWPLTATSFLYSWRNWSWGFNVLPATWDNVVANKYDDWTWWASTPNWSVTINKWTLQKLWYVSSLSLVAIEFWQVLYNTEAEAEAARSTETIVNPSLLWASFRWWLIVRWWATTLNTTSNAVFVDSWKFWSTTWWTWSGSSTTTLQQAHDNSTLPQITTDSLEIQQKTSNTNNTQVWRNVAWTITASIRWDGTPTATTDLTTKTYVDTWLWTKQATLVSWTNIKTINGSTLLWSGDLVVWGSPIYQTFIAWELTTGQIARFVSKWTQTIAWVKISTATLPTGANLQVQVYKNWTSTTNSIFTSDTPISITTGQGATNGIYISTSTTIDNGSLVENDVLYFYITQIWSTLSGTNLEIVMY